MCDCDNNDKSMKKEFGWDTDITVCAPMKDTIQPIIPSSCLSVKALMNIIETWNYENEQDTINIKTTNDVNQLYHLLKEKMKQKYGCKTEKCWINSLEYPQGSREYLFSFFKPEYPVNFKETPNDWWSSSQIDRVIRPYIYSHPFYWCGVVPLDFKEQRRMNLCLSKEICAVDLKELINRGCRLVAAIFNLDYSYEQGSHWVLGFVDITRGNVCFLDSYGYEPLALIKEWMDNCSSTLNKMVKQNEWTNCESYISQFDADDITFLTNLEFKINTRIPNHLKIDIGMIMESITTGRKFSIVNRIGRKQYVLDNVTKKKERDGGWIISGARTFTLSRRVQRSGSECGSYCIHTLLESLQGKCWKQIIREMPGDFKIKQIRQKLHQNI